MDIFSVAQAIYDKGTLENYLHHNTFTCQVLKVKGLCRRDIGLMGYNMADYSKREEENVVYTLIDMHLDVWSDRFSFGAKESVRTYSLYKRGQAPVYQDYNKSTKDNPCSEIILDGEPRLCSVSGNEQTKVDYNMKAFETRHYVNGKDQATMTFDDQVAALQQLENQIKTLKKINTNSQAISGKIKEYKIAILSLVVLMDGGEL